MDSDNRIAHSYRVYTIRDIKANTLVSMFTALSDEGARRAFEDLLFRVEDNVFNQHPSDFKLVGGLEIRCYDDKSTRMVGNFIDLVFGSEYSEALIKSKRLDRASYYAQLEKIKNKEEDRDVPFHTETH